MNFYMISLTSETSIGTNRNLFRVPSHSCGRLSLDGIDWYLIGLIIVPPAALPPVLRVFV